MNLTFTLDFLDDLAKHNSREWMESHKKRYHKAKNDVMELSSEVLKKCVTFDDSLEGVEPKETIFRINRDIRFSKNKAPYKTNFGIFLVEGGRNSGNPGYYIHLMPNNTFIGGGVYQPQAAILQKIRQEIDFNGNKLRSILESPTFKEYYSKPHVEDRLKTAPKGYSRDHPYIDLLQLKHHVYMYKVPQEEVISNRFVDIIAESFKVLYPYNQFLKEAMS